jgi:hypothetical protein
MFKIDAKKWQKSMGYKLTEKWLKNDQIWRGKIDAKNGQKLTSMGGVQNDKNRSILMPGTRGG